MAGVADPRRQDAEVRIQGLVERYGLPDVVRQRLQQLLCLVVRDPLAPTAIRDPLKVADDHLADSLVALELEELRSATQIVDLGAGAGFPGLPLAIALPGTTVALVECARRKCAFIAGVARECSLANAEVVNVRAEEWDDGLERFDVATARALAPLDVVVEYAAPLLRVGGTLVAWRGKHEPEVEHAAARAAEIVGMKASEPRRVMPYADAHARYLYLMSKVMMTPDGFPRRAGVALKRPLGGRSPRVRPRGPRVGNPSDRSSR